MKVLPFMKKVFGAIKPSKASHKVSTELEQTAIKSEPIKIAQSVTPQATETNPYLQYIYDIYEKDGVSREVVDRVVLGGERLRYYRYVDESELQKLLSGEHITSTRPCHGGRLTDVTSNPNYSKIPTLGKYRLKFKNRDNFTPYPLNKESSSRIVEHNLGNEEFYLRGGYCLNDIEKIEQKIDTDTFKQIDFLG